MTSPAPAFDRPASSAPGDSAREGFSGASARADHVHAREAADANLGGSITASAPGDTTSAGVATTGARSDHRHAREAFATTSDIADVAATESAGSAATVARGDHVHALSGLGAWSTYSPTWTATTTNPTNYTASGRYVVLGKICHFTAQITFTASTTFGTGGYLISLPVASFNAAPSMSLLGAPTGLLDRSVAGGGSRYPLTGRLSPGTSSMALYYYNASAPAVIMPNFNSGSPVALTASAGDFFMIAGTYETS